MKEVIYNVEKDFGNINYSYINFPKIKVYIKVLKLKKDYTSYYINNKLENYFNSFKEGDIVLLEYPIFFNRRNSTTLYSFPICITNETLNRSEDIDSSKLVDFWRLIEEFSIL